MNQTTECMSSQGGQANSEAVTGQSVVALSFLTQQFHRVQSRLKNRKAAGDPKGGGAVRPLFQPELTGLEPQANLDRIYSYKKKLAAMEAA